MICVILPSNLLNLYECQQNTEVYNRSIFSLLAFKQMYNLIWHKCTLLNNQ